MHHVGEAVEEQAGEVGDLSEDFVGIVGAVVGAEVEEVDAAVMMAEEVGVVPDAAVMMVADADAAMVGEEDMVVGEGEGEEAVIMTLIQYSASKFLFWFIISLPWVKPSDVRNLLGARLLLTQRSLLPKMGSLRK